MRARIGCIVTAPPQISQSAVECLRCVHGVLLLGDVLRGWDAVGVWSCVVDALNTPGKIPADHITNI